MSDSTVIKTTKSLRMQAAFHTQNPWGYGDYSQMYQKETAYVCDFVPVNDF